MNKFTHHSIAALWFAAFITLVFALLFNCRPPSPGDMDLLCGINVFPFYVTQMIFGAFPIGGHWVYQVILFILVFVQWFLVGSFAVFVFKRFKLHDYFTSLIILAWIASVISLPIYFFTMIGIGMGDGPSPHATAGELLMLAACPVIATAAIVFAFILCKVTCWRFVSLILPGLLSLAELAFTWIVWWQG